jgi:hypothetical protein
MKRADRQVLFIFLLTLACAVVLFLLLTAPPVDPCAGMP